MNSHLNSHLPLTRAHASSVATHEERRRKHTIIGFMSGVMSIALLVLLLNILDITPYVRVPEQRTIPIELMQLGELTGETTGAQGNMSEEGAAAQGMKSPEPLADASPKASTKTSTSSADNTPASRVVASNAVRNDAASKPSELKPQTQPQAVREFTNNAFPKPAENVKTSPISPNLTAQTKPSASTPSPAKNTSDDGSGGGAKSRLLADASGGFGLNEGDGGGLGRYGGGSGRGAGYGLEWGGGGNRVVLHKEMPKYPNGVNTSAQIKIRFTVLPNGSVGVAMPMQKGEPMLERAAIEALRRWQFNPLSDEKEMVGFITFTFRVQ
jgi:TonB family protein